MPAKKVFIQTIGCQMNVYDSERIGDLMSRSGYGVVDSADQADLIIVNTCAIRDKAEQKLYSLLGRLAPLKQQNPDTILAVGGCVAQQEGAAMLSRVPCLDLVFGTDALNRLPALVDRVALKKARIVDVGPRVSGENHQDPGALISGGGISRFVTIMRGCDNYCTYCVVPFVRGRETSRPPEQIIKEIKMRVAAGAREVTLLGQNVNSYGNKEGLASFPDLLARVNKVSGLERIRFTTSHPKDLSGELIAAFGRLEKLCRHIHLPVQSGSDKILHRMNRKYTRTHFAERVARLRADYPDIAITSDIIVGFPGETESDFQMTLDLIRGIRFDSLFAFKYSDRPNAAAAQFNDKIPAKEKSRRLQALLDLQQQITLEKNKALIGTSQIVLVEGFSKISATKEVQWSGRTSTYKIVNFRDDPFRDNQARPPGGNDLTGKLITVVIKKGFFHSLLGTSVTKSPIHVSRKGVQSRAA